MSRRLIAWSVAAILALAVGVVAVNLAEAQEATELGESALPFRRVAREGWAALTDDQKAELQAARNRVLDARLQLLEKQAELGLVDPRVVEVYRERLEWMKQAPPGLGYGPHLRCPGCGLRGGRGVVIMPRGAFGPWRGPMWEWRRMGPIRSLPPGPDRP